jgi:peptidoglycan L-alanyl-D-glutamate endopeptidase CwlK
MPVFRSSEEEDALFEAGKSKARGGQSYHNYGLAIDLCELTPDLKGIATWDMSKLVPISQKYKLEWGGSWKSFKDKPHFELRFEFKENCSDLILLPKDAHGYAILPPLAV